MPGMIELVILFTIKYKKKEARLPNKAENIFILKAMFPNGEMVVKSFPKRQ